MFFGTKIEHIEKIVPDAYHGTKLDIAIKITEGSTTFLPSKGDGQYLGDGVYFFESSQWHAMWWAQKIYNKVDFGIICATINLGKCFDFGNREHLDILENVRNFFLKKGHKKLTDAFVINFYATKIEDFDTVKAVYIQPRAGKLFQGSRFFRYQQNLICVRNINRILKCTLVCSGGQDVPV